MVTDPKTEPLLRLQGELPPTMSDFSEHARENRSTSQLRDLRVVHTGPFSDTDSAPCLSSAQLPQRPPALARVRATARSES